LGSSVAVEEAQSEFIGAREQGPRQAPMPLSSDWTSPVPPFSICDGGLLSSLDGAKEKQGRRGAARQSAPAKAAMADLEMAEERSSSPGGSPFLARGGSGGPFFPCFAARPSSLGSHELGGGARGAVVTLPRWLRARCGGPMFRMARGVAVTLPGGHELGYIPINECMDSGLWKEYSCITFLRIYSLRFKILVVVDFSLQL
jgi:hypothetical protein